jgi:microcompartment protein CcmK/EutM
MLNQGSAFDPEGKRQPARQVDQRFDPVALPFDHVRQAVIAAGMVGAGIMHIVLPRSGGSGARDEQTVA